jgi:hypothetical protein
MMDWSQLYRNPFLWVYLTALFSGGAVGRLVRSRWTRKDPVIAASLLAASGLVAFSAGILLSPGFMPLSPLFAPPFAAAFIAGILAGFAPLISLPLFAACLLLLYGSLFLVLNLKRGFPLHEGDARLTVLRIFDEGGGSIELYHSGSAEIFRVGTDRILLGGRLLRVNRYLPWPHGTFLYLDRAVEPPPAEDEYLLHESVEAAEPWRDLLERVLLAGPILVSDQKFSDPVELRLLASYRIWEEGDEIGVGGLSFPAQKADTGE